MRTSVALLGALFIAAPLSAQRPASTPADLIVTNARVYTADEARPLAEAFAVRDGRIVFVGSRQEADALKGASTRVIDAAGRTVIPGMVDAHAHFGGLAQTLRSVDLDRHPQLRRGRRARGRASKGGAQGQLDPGARLGPECVGRHAIPDAREAHRGGARSSGGPHARGRTRLAGERRRHAHGRPHRGHRRTRAAARSSGTRRATRPGC